MKKDSIFITGATGMLANTWYINCKKKYNPFLLHNKKIKGKNLIQIDYFNLDKFSKIIKKFDVKLIIHTAGMTNVEKCEFDKKKALNSNLFLTKAITKVASKNNVKIIYISTDHIFDGKHKRGYSETSKTCPLNNYAKTKLLSESFIKKNLKNFIIIRTNFFGKSFAKKKSFSDIILRNLKSGKKLTLFDDIFFNPISMNELVKVSMKMYEKSMNGIFNIGTKKIISKFEFGKQLAKHYGLNKNLILKTKIKKKVTLKRPSSMFLKISKLENKIKFNSSLKKNFFLAGH